jgi:hypothetical protein
MYRPKQSDQESGVRDPRDALERHLPNWLWRPGEEKGENKLSQKKVEQNAATDVQEHISEMKAELVRVPK